MSDTRHEENHVDREDEYDTNPGMQGKWISMLIALAGVWLVGEALLVDFFLEEWMTLGIEDFWNDLVVGLALIALGAYNYSRRAGEKLGSAGAAGLAALLGLWLIVSPFAFGIDVNIAEFTLELGFWHDAIIGLLVFLLSLYSISKTRAVDVGSPSPE